MADLMSYCEATSIRNLCRIKRHNALTIMNLSITAKVAIIWIHIKRPSGNDFHSHFGRYNFDINRETAIPISIKDFLSCLSTHTDLLLFV